MANTVVISKAHLIYGICLPLAILVGYVLAEPLQSGSLAVVVLVLSVLSIPLLMRWHHPLLIFSCNAAIMPYFIPGRPTIWMLMALVSLFFSVLNRTLRDDVRFFRAPAVAHSLLFIGLVVLVTGHFTGGIGFRSLGGASYGGKKYFTIIAAIGLYFAMATPDIKRRHAWMYLALYLLSSLTWLVGYVAGLLGPSTYFLAELFPIESSVSEMAPNQTMMDVGITRMGGFGPIALGIAWYLLARHELRGSLELRKPWRPLVLVACLAGVLLSGYRGNLVLLLLTFGVLFVIEGLHRTRYMLGTVMAAILGFAILIPTVQRLPLSVQRTLSVLPMVDVSFLAREEARSSTAWRLELWGELLPEVPRYLIKGKGLALNPDDLYNANISSTRTENAASGGLALSGDYHNGPLSIIIPFGIFGVIGFLWFMVAATKVLCRNYLYGDPDLQRINAFLLGLFIVRLIFFLFVFGSFSGDLLYFTSIAGLSVSLNGGVCAPPEPEEMADWEEEQASSAA